MAWQDRPWLLRGPRQRVEPTLSILNDPVPASSSSFGIRVRAHAPIILAVLVLIFGLGQGFKIEDRVKSMAVLFVIVLRCTSSAIVFVARWVGGMQTTF